MRTTIMNLDFDARLAALLLAGLTTVACGKSDDDSTRTDDDASEADDSSGADDDTSDESEADDDSTPTDDDSEDDDDDDEESADDAEHTNENDDAEHTNENDDSAANEDAGAISPSAEAGELIPLQGAFRIQLVAPVEETSEIAATPGYVAVLGRVYDGLQPSRTRWVRLEEQGGCELFAPEIPFCDPECASGDVCDADDTCKAPPSPLDLGTVTLEGLATETGDSVSMSPLPPSNSYQPTASAGLSYPPFDPGALVTLSAAGNPSAGVPAFNIEGYGVSQLRLASSGNVAFAPDEASMITWEPPDEGDVSNVELIFDISHHGGQKGELRCEVEDTGQFEVPADLVTGLIELGVAGFPEVRIVRRTVQRAEDAVGNVTLTIESAAVQYLDIPGVVSCAEIGSADGCPEDQVCQQDLRCAE